MKAIEIKARTVARRLIKAQESLTPDGSPLSAIRTDDSECESDSTIPVQPATQVANQQAKVEG